MKRIALLSMALVSMLAFASCSSPKRQAANVTKEFFKALNAGDYDKALEYTATEQAQAYVNLASYFDENKSAEEKVAEPKMKVNITRIEELQDTVICYVTNVAEDAEVSEGDQMPEQKVVLTKVDKKWKIVDLPIK